MARTRYVVSPGNTLKGPKGVKLTAGTFIPDGLLKTNDILALLKERRITEVGSPHSIEDVLRDVPPGATVSTFQGLDKTDTKTGGAVDISAISGGDKGAAATAPAKATAKPAPRVTTTEEPTEENTSPTPAKGKWDANPADLNGKTLDQLNAMIVSRDPEAKEQPTIEAAIEFMSADWIAPQGSQNDKKNRNKS